MLYIVSYYYFHNLFTVCVTMGNKRASKYTHKHRGIYKKKLVPPSRSHTSIEEKKTGSLSGSRIVNLSQLGSFVTDISAHSQSCQQGTVFLCSETRRDGLASTLAAKCNTCNENISFKTSSCVSLTDNSKRWEANVAATWGQMATGGGHARLKEVMSVLGVPVMTKKTFVATESDIGKRWEELLEDSMKQAAEEEKQLAIEQNSYHQGIPAISVIVDAGWSKRSHKHSYNAKSGVGIIIGTKTKKLLYLGVRNKYCSICDRAEAEKKRAKTARLPQKLDRSLFLNGT